MKSFATRTTMGEKVTVHVKAATGRAFPVKVVAFEPPRRMVWSGGMPFGLFKGERTYELLSAGTGQVEFAMHENYTGLLAPRSPDRSPICSLRWTNSLLA